MFISLFTSRFFVCLFYKKRYVFPMSLGLLIWVVLLFQKACKMCALAVGIHDWLGNHCKINSWVIELFGLGYNQVDYIGWLYLTTCLYKQEEMKKRLCLWNYSLVNWNSKHLSTQEETCGPRSCRYSWSWGSGDNFRGSLHRLWPWKEAGAVHTGMREPAVSKDTPIVSLCKGEAARGNSSTHFLCMHAHIHNKT